ncbi:MAG: hypothetical protein K9K64_17015, partial [Desulfohalobiaceae bacterium]|nr:hypothetical protein [Desulfohalobiaceae bacterium]
SPARTFTAELSPNESPQLDVGYNYAGKQSIPATGLSPVRYAALWAANESTRIEEQDILPADRRQENFIRCAGPLLPQGDHLFPLRDQRVPGSRFTVKN